MSKWTPGKWVVDGLAIRSGDGAMIAEAWSGIRADAVDSTQLYRAEAQTANARLIAEAPAMAELIQRYLASADSPLGMAAISDIDADARALLERINK